MKTRILALGGTIVAALTVVALVDAQPVGPVGLQKCTTDTTLTGNCRTGTPLGVSIAGASCGAGSAVGSISGSGAGTCIAVGTGTLTGITAGSGLTGGGTSGTVTVDVGAGNGITVAADTVSANLGTGLTFSSGAIVPNLSGASCAASEAVTAISSAGAGTCSTVGDITSVVAGTGLSGGATSGAATLTVNVAGASCAASEAVTAIGATGTGTCSTVGDITSVVAGTGLSGGATSGAATLTVNVAGASCSADQAVTAIGATGTGTCSSFGSIAGNFAVTGTTTLTGNLTANGNTTLGDSGSDVITFSNGPIGINNYAGKHLEWNEEWLGGSSLTNGQSYNEWTCYQTGASSSCNGVNGLAGRPGINTITAGTAATGASYMMVGGSGPIWADFGTGSYFFEETFSFPTLSTSTNEYIVTTGFADFNGGANQVDGCYIDYDRLPVSTAPATGTISANSNKLSCWCSTGSTRTGYTMDGAIVSDESFTTVDASLTAGNYYRVKILMTGTTRAEFYVDSGSGYTKRCDINTHLPTGAVTGVLHGMLSSASTGGSKVYYVDQTRWGLDLTTVRSP